MKKVYKAPSICVEDARLSAFCSGGCGVSRTQFAEIAAKLGKDFGDGQCYCYHGSDDDILSMYVVVNS